MKTNQSPQALSFLPIDSLNNLPSNSFRTRVSEILGFGFTWKMFIISKIQMLLQFWKSKVHLPLGASQPRYIAIFLMAIFFVLATPVLFKGSNVFASSLTKVESVNVSEERGGNKQAPSSYTLIDTDPNYLSAAFIKGSDCSNLTGSIFYSRKQSEGFWEKLSGYFFGGGTQKNKENLKKWLESENQLKGYFHCLPNVKNILQYLNSPEQPSIRNDFIAFVDGPVLLFRPDRELPAEPRSRPSEIPTEAAWVLGHYLDVSFSNCKAEKLVNEFCVELKVYDKTEARFSLSESSGQYRVVCWTCETLKSSPQALLQAIILGADVFGGGPEFLLRGGYMVPEKFFGDVRLSDVAKQGLGVSAARIERDLKTQGLQKLKKLRDLILLEKVND